MRSMPVSSLQIVPVNYHNATPLEPAVSSTAAYQASGVYSAAGVPYQIVEPRLDDEVRVDSETANIGLLGAEIAAAVAAGRSEGRSILMTGGDCCHITGVIGGLQTAHGPGARIGLVWFDAHGDFNTPQTTMSGMLGGMPVAVCAGLAFPEWRENSKIVAPLPADRILMVDVRNLDPAEEALVRAAGIPIAAAAAGFPGVDLGEGVSELAARCDMLYLHIDSDILDIAWVPNHNTGEPDGPSMAQVREAIETVMATGKVVAFAVVSVSGKGEGAEIAQKSGMALIRSGLSAWARHGTERAATGA
jgi:arginase